MTNTVLKDEIIEDAAWENRMENSRADIPAEVFFFARAIEQAVLQSSEVREMKDALSLVIDLSSQEYIDQNGNRIAVVGNGGERFWFITDNVMGAVRAAMEKQP